MKIIHNTRFLIICCLLLMQFCSLASGREPRLICHTDRDVYIAGETIFFSLKIAGQDPPGAEGIAYLVVRGEGSSLVTKVCIQTLDGAASGSINLPDTLQSGIYQLMAFTNEMRNWGEASFFRKEILVANLFDRELKAFRFHDSLVEPRPIPEDAPGISIRGLKQDYQRGEEVSIRLETEATVLLYSVSVREVCSFNPVIAAKSPVHQGICESLYLQETDGQIIRGRVLAPEAVPSCRVFLSAADTLVNLQYDDTDSAGWFRFKLPDYYQGKEVFIQAVPADPGKTFTIELEDKFRLEQPFVPSARVFPPRLKEYLQESQDMFRVRRSYGQQPPPDTLTIKKPVKDQYRVFDKPDQQVYPSDFEPLPDFREISREILPTVRVRGPLEIQLLDEARGQYFEVPPALFVNGVYTRDVRRIMPMGSGSIHKVEVVNAQRVFGSLTFAGILALVTHSKELTTEPGVHRMRPEPVRPNTRMQHFQPLSGKTLPDFRQLLYWDPAVTASSGQVSFFTSMHTGLFEICVESISPEGEVLREKKYFTVSRNP